MVQMKVLPCNRLGRLRKNIINRSSECWSPGLEENLVPVQCEVARRSGWSCGMVQQVLCCKVGSRPL